MGWPGNQILFGSKMKLGGTYGAKKNCVCYLRCDSWTLWTLLHCWATNPWIWELVFSLQQNNIHKCIVHNVIGSLTSGFSMSFPYPENQHVKQTFKTTGMIPTIPIMVTLSEVLFHDWLRKRSRNSWFSTYSFTGGNILAGRFIFPFVKMKV